MLTSIPSVVHYDVEVTDDPLVSRTPLARLTENSKVTCLGTMGEWTYIEAEADKEPINVQHSERRTYDF